MCLLPHHLPCADKHPPAGSGSSHSRSWLSSSRYSCGPTSTECTTISARSSARGLSKRYGPFPFSNRCWLTSPTEVQAGVSVRRTCCRLGLVYFNHLPDPDILVIWLHLPAFGLAFISGLGCRYSQPMLSPHTSCIPLNKLLEYLTIVVHDQCSHLRHMLPFAICCNLTDARCLAVEYYTIAFNAFAAELGVTHTRSSKLLRNEQLSRCM